MNTKDLLRLGKLMKQEHDLNNRIRAIRDKMRDASHSSTWYPNGVSLRVPLHEYLSQWPDAKPTLNEYTRQEDQQRRAWMSYPTQFIGWIKPGKFALWVEASSPTVDVPTEVKPETPAEEKQAA